MHRPQYLVSALVAAALTLAGCSTPSSPDDDPRVLTEIATVDLDSNTAFGPPTVTGPVLEDGADYVIEVQGTFSVWDCRVTNPGWCKGEPSDAPLFPSPGRANGLVMFDANTWFAVPVGEPRCSTDDAVPIDTQFFVMSLDGGATFTHVPRRRLASTPTTRTRTRSSGRAKGSRSASRTPSRATTTACSGSRSASTAETKEVSSARGTACGSSR